MLRTLSAYGRAERMRSCALRILEAATISMALVIFLVFSTDLILPRISLPAAISELLWFCVSPGGDRGSSGEALLERGNRGRQLRLGFLAQRLRVLDALQ